MEKEWRRSKSTLHILGAGVIGFALWDIVKMLLVMVMIGVLMMMMEFIRKLILIQKGKNYCN